MHLGDTILISSEYPLECLRGRLARVVSLSYPYVAVELLDLPVTIEIPKKHALVIPGYMEHKKSGHLNGQPDLHTRSMARCSNRKSRKTIRQQLYEAARRQGKDLSQPIKLS